MSAEYLSDSDKPLRPWGEFQNTQMYRDIDEILKATESIEPNLARNDSLIQALGTPSSHEAITSTRTKDTYPTEQNPDLSSISEQRPSRFGSKFLRRFRDGSFILGLALGAGGYFLFGEHIPLSHDFFHQASLCGFMSVTAGLSMGVGAESLTEILRRLDRKISSIYHARLPDLLDG